jgi:hypothetical protein
MDDIGTNRIIYKIESPRLTSSKMPTISNINNSMSETETTSNFGYYLTIFFFICIVGFIIGLYYFRNHPYVKKVTQYVKDTVSPYTTLSSTFSNVHYQPSYDNNNNSKEDNDNSKEDDTSNKFYTINGYDPVITNDKDNYSYPDSYTSTKDVSLTPTLPTINQTMIKEPESANKVAGATSSYTQKQNFVINQDTKLNPYNDDTLDRALNNFTQPLPGPSADDSYSSIQANKSSSKSGWCFIGEDRGYRSCVEVGENDICMSGDIFPKKDICINPTLRE